MQSHMKTVSYMTDEVFDLDQKVLSVIGRKKLIEQAGTASVLACLQTPIQAKHFKAHLAYVSHKAIRRLSAFNLIFQMMQVTLEDESLKTILGVLVSWLNCW